MQRDSAMSCSCSEQFSRDRGSCPSCSAQPLQTNRLRQSYTYSYFTTDLPSHLSKSHSNPSGLSVEADRLRQPRPPRPRTAFSHRLLSSAFASDDESSFSIFPPSLYHVPRRRRSRSNFSSSRRTSTATSEDDLSRFSSSTSSSSQSNSGTRSTSRNVSPETSSSESVLYSPMAAGFARLNYKLGPDPIRFETMADRGLGIDSNTGSG